MAVNKVVFGAVAIMDISDSTVTPNTLGKGATAYDKAGEKITGILRSADDVLETITMNDTLLWDGNTEGKTLFDMLGDGTYTYYLVSEIVPSLSDLVNGVTITMHNPSSNTTDEVTINNFINNHNVIVSQTNSSVIIATIDNVGFYGGTIPKKGIYFMSNNTYGYVSKIKIKEYTGFNTDIQVAKEEYIPDDYMVADEIATQDSLISQIQTALQGKAAGGGVSIGLCTVKINASTSTYRFKAIGYTTIDDNGNLIAKTVTVSANDTTINNVVCGSMLACMGNVSLIGGTPIKANMLYSNASYGGVFYITAQDGETAWISAGTSGGGSIL